MQTVFVKTDEDGIVILRPLSCQQKDIFQRIEPKLVLKRALGGGSSSSEGCQNLLTVKLVCFSFEPELYLSQYNGATSAVQKARQARQKYAPPSIHMT